MDCFLTPVLVIVRQRFGLYYSRQSDLTASLVLYVDRVLVSPVLVCIMRQSGLTTSFGLCETEGILPESCGRGGALPASGGDKSPLEESSLGCLSGSASANETPSQLLQECTISGSEGFTAVTVTEK